VRAGAGNRPDAVGRLIDAPRIEMLAMEV